MSDLDAGATLNLSVKTDRAEHALGELQKKYQDLINALNAGAKPVELSTGESAAQIKTLTAHVATLEAQLQKVGKSSALSQLSKMSAAQSAEEIASRKKAIAELVRMSAAGSAEEIAARRKAISELARMSAAASVEEIQQRRVTRNLAIAEARKALQQESAMRAAMIAEETLQRKNAESMQGLNLSGQRAAELAKIKAADAAFVAESRRLWKTWQADQKLQDLNLSGQRAAELAKIKAADAAFVAESRRLWKAWQADQKLQDLNLSGQRAAELAKIKAADAAFVAESRRLWKTWQVDQASLAQWSALSQKQQLSLALKSATVSAAGGNASLLPGLAGSTQAAQMAKQGVAALEQQLAKLTPATNAATKAHHGLGVAFGDTHALARGLSGSLGQLWMTYGNIAPLLAGAALGSAFKNAMQFGAEMEYQLTFVKALGGESAAAMDRLNETALNLGKSSLVGPVELASGLRILAQAGLTADQAIQALPKTLDLAIVGEMKMEEAAITLAGVMNAFKLSVGDMGHIGDVFAQAAAMSQSSVVDMTNAMRTASVVGEQYGVSMEDTAAALTLLAKVNIKGTAAGTALRNMVKELYAPTAQSAAVMKKLGLETADATGNLRPMADVIYDLRGKLAGFDKASQVNILQKLFGERGAKEAIAMLSLTREEWDKLVGKLEESEGFMRNVAAQLEQTTKGAFLQAKNALQGGLVEAFNATDGAAKQLALSLRDLANSGVLAAGIEILVVSLTNLANVAAQAAPALLLMAEAWAATKVLAAANAGWVAAGAALVRFRTALLPITGALAAASGAMGPVAAGAGTAATATALLTRGITAFLGPVGLAVTALGSLYMAYRYIVGDTPKVVEGSRSYASALEFERQRLEEVNKELEKKLRLQRTGSAVDVEFHQQQVNAAKARLSEIDKALPTASGLDEFRLNSERKTIYEEMSKAERALTAAQKLEEANRIASAKLYAVDQKRILDETIVDIDNKSKIVTKRAAEVLIKHLQTANLSPADEKAVRKQIDSLLKELASSPMPSGSDVFEMGGAFDKKSLERYHAEYLQTARDGMQKIQAAYAEFDSELKQQVERGTVSIATAHEMRIAEIERSANDQMAAIAEQISAARVDPKFTDEAARTKEISKLQGELAKVYAATRKAVANEQYAIVQDQEKFGEMWSKAETMAFGKVLSVADAAKLEFDNAFEDLFEQIQARILDGVKGSEEELIKFQELRDKYIKAKEWEKALDGISKAFDNFAKELNLIYKSADEQGIFAIFGSLQDAERQKQDMLRKMDEYIAEVRAKRDALNAAGDYTGGTKTDAELKSLELKRKELEREIPKMIDDWGNSLGEVVAESLVYGFEEGESPAKKFANYLKSELYKAIAVALSQQFKLGLTSMFGGSSGGAGSLLSAGNSVYGLFSGNTLNTLASSPVGGALGLSAAGLSMASVGGTTGVMAGGAFYPGAIGAMQGSAAVGSLSGIGSMLGSALPWIGGALAVASLFSDSGGGPKTEGGLVRTIGGGTAELSSTGQKFFTGDGADAAVAAILDPLADGIAEWARKLGGDASGLEIGLGFNSDPQGTAGDSVGGGVYRNGEELYFRAFGGYGRGTYQQELVAETNRLMLAALESLDLNDLADAYLDGLDIAGLSADAAAQAVGFLQATQQIVDAFGVLGIGADAVTVELLAMMGGVDAAVSALNGYYQTYYSEQERNAILTGQLADRFADLNLAMPATKDEFRALVESLDLTTTGGQEAYAALMGMAPAFATVADAAEQSAQAMARAAEEARTAMKTLYDDLIGGLRTAVETAWDGVQRTFEQAMGDRQEEYDTAIAGIDAAAEAARAAFDAAQTAADVQRRAIQSAYDAQIGTIDAQRKILDNAVEVERTRYDAESDRIGTLLDDLADPIKTASEAVSRLESLTDSLSDTLDGLRIQGSEQQYRTAAQAQIRDALAMARTTGALPDADSLKSALSTISQPSQDLFATFEDYARDFYRTAIDIRDLNDITQGSLETARTELDVLTSLETSYQSQLDELRTANETALAALDLQRESLDLQRESLDEAYRRDTAAIDSTLETARTQMETTLSDLDTQRTALTDAFEADMQVFEDQLAAQRDIYEAALGIDSRVLGVQDAIAALAAAVNALSLQPGTPDVPTSVAPVYDQWQTSGNVQAFASSTGAGAVQAVGNTDPTGIVWTDATGVNRASQDVLTAAATELLGTGQYAELLDRATTLGLSNAALSQIAGVAAETIDAWRSDTITLRSGWTGTKDELRAGILSEYTAGRITADQIYMNAISEGLTSGLLDEIMQWPFGTTRQYGIDHNLPAFAAGTNFVPSDMVAQIHTGERIIPAADNAVLMARLNDGSRRDEVLVAEIRELRAEVSRLREENRAAQTSIATNTRKAAKALDQWDVDGMPEVRAA